MKKKLTQAQGLTREPTPEERCFIRSVKAANLRWHPNLGRKELQEILELSLLKRRLEGLVEGK